MMKILETLLALLAATGTTAPTTGSPIATGQKAVNSTVGALTAASTSFAKGFKLTNLSTSNDPLFYGTATVSATTGDELAPGASVVLTMSDASLIGLICAGSGTATASFAGLL